MVKLVLPKNYIPQFQLTVWSEAFEILPHKMYLLGEQELPSKYTGDLFLNKIGLKLLLSAIDERLDDSIDQRFEAPLPSAPILLQTEIYSENVREP